ncbi:hypothetical protein Tco_0004583 [Tanacetum coccineum]
MEILHPPSPDYVRGPEHPPLPDYVSGPEEPEQAPLSPDYVLEPEYLEYLVPSDAEEPTEDQPLPNDASPIALSMGYVADSDPEEDPADYSESRAMTAVGVVNERVTDLATTQRQDAHELYVHYEDAQDDRALLRAQVSVLTRERRYFRLMASSYEYERQRIRDEERLMSHIQHEHDRFKELVRCRANRTSGNGDDSHDSRTDSRRTERTARECTYNDFLKYQPLNFKGTEGVVSLTQWFEKMESVLHISNCTVACQIKFATCTLLGNALTWWNSHVKTVGRDDAYMMPWKTLKKMMTAKYCPKRQDQETRD